MKNWVRLIARLYPKSWRRRYGAEFDALLEDVVPRWGDAFDVLRGVLEMHMKVWSFPALAVVCGIAGAIVAAGIAFRIPDKYASEAVLRVSSTPLYVNRIIQESLSRSSLEKVIRKNGLYPRERQRKPLDDVVDLMRHDLSIVPNGARSPGQFTFVVRYVYGNPVQAEKATQDLVANLITAGITEALSMNNPTGHTAAEQMPTVEQLSSASLPQGPASPNRLLITGLGVAAGVVLAALATLALRNSGTWKRYRSS